MVWVSFECTISKAEKKHYTITWTQLFLFNIHTDVTTNEEIYRSSH